MTEPIPMRLACEACGKLHIDEGEFLTKPHHTHSCQFCGLTWRPAVVHTVGVQFLPGFKNEPFAADPSQDDIRPDDVWAGEAEYDIVKVKEISGHINSVTTITLTNGTKLDERLFRNRYRLLPIAR